MLGLNYLVMTSIALVFSVTSIKTMAILSIFVAPLVVDSVYSGYLILGDYQSVRVQTRENNDLSETLLEGTRLYNQGNSTYEVQGTLSS